MPGLDQARHKIYVEGPDDLAVINAIVWARIRHPDCPEEVLDLAKSPHRLVVPPPKEQGGFDWALGQFTEALRTRTLERVGLVVDRDGNHGRPDRWPPIQAALTGAGVTQPALEGGGLITTVGGSLRIGVWLMPDNLSPGDLEDALGRLARAEAPDWKYSADVVAEAKKRGAEFRDVDEVKARLHTWLAWREEPGRPYGTAIKTGALRTNDPLVDAFTTWFRRLFLDD